MDKLINVVNRNSTNRIYMFYSSPDCYTSAKHQADLTWTTNSYDYLPLRSEGWGLKNSENTSFFISEFFRPRSKAMTLIWQNGGLGFTRHAQIIKVTLGPDSIIFRKSWFLKKSFLKLNPLEEKATRISALCINFPWPLLTFQNRISKNWSYF